MLLLNVGYALAALFLKNWADGKQKNGEIMFG